MEVHPIHQLCPPTRCAHNNKIDPDYEPFCKCGDSDDLVDWMMQAIPLWKQKLLKEIEDISPELLEEKP